MSHVKTIVVDARKNGIETSPQIDNFKGFEVEADKVIFTFEEIEKINVIAKENVTSIDNVSQASEHLHVMTENLNNELGKFKS